MTSVSNTEVTLPLLLSVTHRCMLGVIRGSVMWNALHLKAKQDAFSNMVVLEELFYLNFHYSKC